MSIDANTAKQVAQKCNESLILRVDNSTENPKPPPTATLSSMYLILISKHETARNEMGIPKNNFGRGEGSAKSSELILLLECIKGAI